MAQAIQFALSILSLILMLSLLVMLIWLLRLSRRRHEEEMRLIKTLSDRTDQIEKFTGVRATDAPPTL